MFYTTQRTLGILWWAAVSALSMVLLWSCSQDQNPLPSKSHPENWSIPLSQNFHGMKVKAAGSNSCKSCHGGDYNGGQSGVSCFGCHAGYPHPEGWLNRSSGNFHAHFLEENGWDLKGCGKCHGTDYQGGTSGRSCFTCHPKFPHPEGWLAKGDVRFHGNDIRQKNWSMESCKRCHGQDYRGGATGSSCYKCHTSEGGPEACNVCHGNREHSYPPEDLNNNTSTQALGVGAHQKHMKKFQCEICHVVPAAFNDPSHIDAPPAEVHAEWTWNRSTANCATSCHGGKLIWNDFD